MYKILLLMTLLLSLSRTNAQKNNFKQVDSKVFKELIEKNKGTLLDVRTSSEFMNGHIKKAGQLNYYALNFKKRLLLLPKDQPIYLYCNTGYRSKKAAQTLSKNGYTNVYNLEQGIMEWELYNLPVIKDPGAKPDTKDKMESDEFMALTKSSRPVFIDFYAPWCAPCRKMMPMIDKLKTEFKGKITVVKINVDASKKLVKQLKLVGVPYLIMYKNGKKTFEHNGIIEKKELLKAFQSER